MTVSLTGIPRTGGHARSNRAPIVVAANGQTIVTSDPSRQFQLTLNEDGFGPSDHSSFYAKQIPVLFFWTGTHEDYHKPSDTADKINYEDEARILSFVARIVRNIDAEAKRPTYAVAKSQAAGRTTGGFSVSLGTIPNYADSNDGLLIDGVREDSPAAKAGIKAGDKIVKLAGRDIRNVYDYTARARRNESRTGIRSGTDARRRAIETQDHPCRAPMKAARATQLCWTGSPPAMSAARTKHSAYLP